MAGDAKPVPQATATEPGPPARDERLLADRDELRPAEHADLDEGVPDRPEALRPWEADRRAQHVGRVGVGRMDLDAAGHLPRPVGEGVGLRDGRGYRRRRCEYGECQAYQAQAR